MTGSVAIFPEPGEIPNVMLCDILNAATVYCFLVPNFYVIWDKSVVINVQKETAETV